MTIVASGTLATGAKIQYLCTIFRGEVLNQFDLFSDDVEGMKPLTVETIILGLASYFPPCELAIEDKACDAPWNEEAAWIKSKTIRGSFY